MFRYLRVSILGYCKGQFAGYVAPIRNMPRCRVARSTCSALLRNRRLWYSIPKREFKSAQKHENPNKKEDQGNDWPLRGNEPSAGTSLPFQDGHRDISSR